MKICFQQCFILLAQLKIVHSISLNFPGAVSKLNKVHPLSADYPEISFYGDFNSHRLSADDSYANWDENNPYVIASDNDMDGIYTLIIEDLSPGSYSFKVIAQYASTV